MSKEIASDSGHYYTADGTPAYTVIGKNRKERNTNIKDARQLGLLPSVTEVMKVLPKPALIRWMNKQVLMAALTLTRNEGESDEAYIDRIMYDAEEHSRQAREKGTAIHGAIERRLLGFSVEPEYETLASSAIMALLDHIGTMALLDHISTSAWLDLDPEKSFASPLGYGGKVDLHSKPLNFVCDFKTKEFTEETKQLVYDEQIIQLEAYRHGLGMPTARMINVFISTSVLGLVRVVEHEDKDGKYMDVFKACLAFWQVLKGYNQRREYVKQDSK